MNERRGKREAREEGEGRRRKRGEGTRELKGDSHMLTDTRGSGIMSSIFHAYEPHKGELDVKQNGALIAYVFLLSLLFFLTLFFSSLFFSPFSFLQMC